MKRITGTMILETAERTRRESVYCGAAVRSSEIFAYAREEELGKSGSL